MHPESKNICASHIPASFSAHIHEVTHHAWHGLLSISTSRSSCTRSLFRSQASHVHTDESADPPLNYKHRSRYASIRWFPANRRQANSEHPADVPPSRHTHHVVHDGCQEHLHIYNAQILPLSPRCVAARLYPYFHCVVDIRPSSPGSGGSLRYPV